MTSKDGWFVSGIETDKQIGSLNEFIEKEGKWFNYIRGFEDAGIHDNVDTGEFSLQGWLDDTINAAKDLKANPKVNSVWLAGFGTGGALAISAASRSEEVTGVAAISSPSDFHDWVQDPDQLLEYSRAVGAISDPDFPQDKNSWEAEIDSVRPLTAAEKMNGKPLLVVHGASDQVVPSFDARVIADAHGNADLRIIDGGTHRLRFDPRATAIIIGWLDRTHRLQTKDISPNQYSSPKGK